jgi:hypothetical protein
MRNFDTYGKTFADAIAEVHSAGQVQAGSLRSVVAPLGALPAGAKTAICDGPRVKEAMKAVAAVLDRGIDAGLLRNVLKNDLYAGAIPAIGEATAYTRADLLEDLAKVASAPSVQGLDRLVTSLSWGSSGRFGYRYELEVAAWLVREKGAQSLQFVQKQVWDGGELVTDIDIIADGVYYQAKRSGDAFKGGARGIVEWVSGAVKDGGTETAYVTPRKASIPAEAAAQIERYSTKLRVPARIVEIPVR